MGLLTWSDKYSVGVQSMDSQHSILFEILNDLHDAMIKGRAQSAASDLLRKLVNYANEHFAAEETLMETAGYPELAQHRALHRDLTQKIEEFMARCNSGETTLNPHLLNFLRDWLSNHIGRVDHKYGIWINEHGVR
jgi:hemerythrin